jgi:hypothetical protein
MPRSKDSLTPSVLVAKFRENQNNNKTLKSLFSTQFLGKFSVPELEGMKKSIEKELDKRQQEIVDEKIEFLKELGYTVSK